MALASIDQIDGEFALLVDDDGKVTKVPRAKLPKGAKAGVVIDLATMQIDEAATERLREETQEAMDQAKPNQKPGDFSL